MDAQFKLTRTQKKNGSFDYVVVSADGTVISTRNSFRDYRSATVVRTSRSYMVRRLPDMLTWKDHSEAFYADTREKLAELEKMIAEDRQYPAGVLSFNSKPTPVTARQAGYGIEFLGFALLVG